MAETGGEPRVYLLPLTQAEKLPEAYCRAHFPQRTARAERFRFRADALRCLGAGALLYHVLGVREESLTFSPAGKPLLSDGPAFNLSHSGDFVALCVGGDLSPVGIDVEETDARHLSIARRVMTAHEIKFIGDDATRFFTLWTLKEAVCKAAGTGIGVDLTALNVLPLLTGDSVHYAGADWYGATVKVTDHCLSVCARRPVGPLHPILLGCNELLS